MLATIAVGTDGSETASKAVAVAVEIARRFDAELVLLSAFKDSSAPSRPRGTAVELQWVSNEDSRVREMLSRAEQELREQKIECRTMIDEGDPAEVLVPNSPRSAAPICS